MNHYAPESNIKEAGKGNGLKVLGIIALFIGLIAGGVFAYKKLIPSTPSTPAPAVDTARGSIGGSP